jgi:hypothetical protein
MSNHADNFPNSRPELPTGPHPIVTVESSSDPDRPGRTAFRIRGPSRESVQRQIDKVIAEVDEQSGCATFHGPTRLAGGRWGALGEKLIFAEVDHG